MRNEFDIAKSNQGKGNGSFESIGWNFLPSNVPWNLCQIVSSKNKENDSKHFEDKSRKARHCGGGWGVCCNDKRHQRYNIARLTDGDVNRI